ncbi:MAG: RrF2 family transcriptional regulator [Eubacteriaceae bacterium]
MQLQISTDYAIRIVSYLHKHKGTLITASDLSKILGIKSQYLMKITHKLRKGEILESVQGCNGGFRLLEKGEEISLYKIICIMEGEIRINRCLEDDGYCSRNATDECKWHKLLCNIQERLIDDFKKAKISDL